MDAYVYEGLKQDPDKKLLAELDQKIQQITKGALALEEQAQSADTEAELQKKLKNI